MSALIFIITLLLTFWLLSLVWSQKVAKRIFQVIISLGIIIALCGGVYVAYQGYRWTALINQLNQRSLTATEVVNSLPVSR